MFPVYDISGFVSQLPENVGSKEKRWVMPPRGHQLPHRPHLFKIGRENTGENWSEKVCSEIGRALNLPCAKYEFAVSGTEKGVLSETFLPVGARLYLGNVLLSTIVDGYDGAKRFKQIEYKLSRVLNLIRLMPGTRAPIDWEGGPDLLPAHEFFIGYLVLDALVGNTDRHHENWGLVVRTKNGSLAVHLTPSFDHASSLGRNEPSPKRQFRLTTKDARASVEAYAKRGRCAFFGAGPNRETLTMRGMIQELVKIYPGPTKLWATRVAGLTRETFEGIFAQVSSEWITEDAVEFAVRMLLCNQAMIREVALG